MQGWIKLHRSMTDHFLWSNEPFTKGQAWIDLLLHANFTDNKIMLKGQVLHIKAGQQARSEYTLSKHWQWSKNKVRRFLKVLKNEGMIEIKTTPLTSIITICNYRSFQFGETTGGTTPETGVETIGAPEAANSKECKERKNEKKVNIPYQLIVDAYHEHAPNLPKVQILTDKRKAAIKRFWNKDPRHQEIEFYKNYYQHVNQLKFLIGDIEQPSDRLKPWKADLIWLMNIDNLAKVMEGKYNND